MATVDLTPSDTHTLSLLFNPESAPPPPPRVLPSHPTSPLFPSLRASELAALSLPPPAAFDALSTLLASAPTYSSAYNNRAQLRRLLSHPRDSILSDLDAAILHADAEEETVHRNTVLVNALTLRALLVGAAAAERGEDGEGRVRADMERAAGLGGDVAREWCVRWNPYARLCGEIVGEALKREAGVGVGV
ncbi:hypothetical protein EDC01DRAFT_484996 [Geopyxis carbonaria]|nr:hypothetical protein EDC01DRAFT_484996 [Geopyxis carbonaria]